MVSTVQAGGKNQSTEEDAEDADDGVNTRGPFTAAEVAATLIRTVLGEKTGKSGTR